MTHDDGNGIDKLDRYGIAWGLAQASLASAMALLASQPPLGIGAFEIVMHRSVFAMIALMPWVLRETPSLLRRQSYAVWLRAFCGAGGVLCLFHNIVHTTAPMAALLASMSPVLTLILASVFLRESMTNRQLLGCAMCVSAALICPWSGTLRAEPTDVAVGILGAFLTAMAFVALRKSGSLGTPPLLVVWLLSTVTSVVSLPGADVRAMFNHGAAPELLSIASLSLGAQVSLTACYRRLPAWAAVVTTRISLLMTAAGDWIWRSRLPDITEIIAICLLFLGVIVISRQGVSKSVVR